ncbi:MAG TPA: DUF1835 domain-containing protein [Chitinophagaceae bacterium]|nr:DUF1835 domain-containing protein [Chitinophagaceae bacterium]
MIHCVFQQADVTTLKKVLELDDSLAGTVLEIKDEFAVGPLDNLDTEEGWNARSSWWNEQLQQSPYSAENLVGSFDDRKTVEDLKNFLNENEQEQLWIWMGQNGHDVCGYYWLVSQLKEYVGRVMILYMNNLPFLNEKGQLFYPTTLHQIQPKEFLKAKKLCRKITPSEFEIDPDEWKRLVAENATIRILEGGKKIVSKEDNFYDSDILNGLTGEWQKGNRAMQSILTKMKIKTGDVFLLGRMKKLEQADKIEINGDTAKGWKDFEVRLKINREAEVPVPES